MKIPSYDLWFGYMQNYDANLFKKLDEVFLIKAKMHGSQNELSFRFGKSV